MKIYIASHCIKEAQRAAVVLEEKGHTICSQWMFALAKFNATESHAIVERQQIAVMDVDDVTACDHLVLLAGPEKYSGGKFVEAGIAMGQGKPVTIVGRRENMLLWHPSIKTIDDIREFPNA